MTDAVRELFEMLAKKEKSGSDYTGRVTRVEGGTAYVQFDGSDIPNTPVALSIGAKAGDEVRIRVADGKAWIVGNDTNPPTDDSTAQEVAEEMVDMRTRVTGLQGQYTEIQRTADNISTIVSDGDKLVSVINQSAGEVLIQAEKINLDGYTKISEGEIGGFKTIKGDSGCAAKTTANGGHAYPTSFYKQMDDGTYEYEVGMKGDSGDPGYVNFYVKRMTAGGAWSSASDVFYVKNSGKLYAENADITGKITATSGSFKGSIDASAFKATYSNSNLTMTAQLTGGGLYIESNVISPSTKRYLLLDPSTTIWRNTTTDTGPCAYVTSRGFAISDNGVKGDGYARVNILATEISQYDASGNHGTRIHSANVDVGNSTTNGRTGRLTSSDAGNIGIYDVDEEEYIIYSSSSHAVFIPHPTTLESVATYNGFQKPVGSYDTDGRRVAYVSARVDGSNYQFRVSGQWGATGSNYSVKTIWSSSTSDVRLKKHIKDTDVNGLDAVNRMRLRQFDWRRDGKHQGIGFVADELEAIDPDLALGGGYDEDGNMDEKQVNTYMVVAYLTKAVQELSAKVEELENKLSAMEDKNHGHS